MNSDPRTFEGLRRLLVLKRYEQPPPGYFDRFPGEVIARIREYKSAEGIEPGVAWLRRLWIALEYRAVFPAAVGAAVCSVLVLGLVRSSGIQASPMAIGKPLDHNPYAPINPPIGIPVAERTAFASSTAGVLPDQHAVGIFQGTLRPRNPVFH
jgi:hypothetical protein